MTTQTFPAHSTPSPAGYPNQFATLPPSAPSILPNGQPASNQIPSSTCRVPPNSPPNSAAMSMSPMGAGGGTSAPVAPRQTTSVFGIDVQNTPSHDGGIVPNPHAISTSYTPPPSGNSVATGGGTSTGGDTSSNLAISHADHIGFHGQMMLKPDLDGLIRYNSGRRSYPINRRKSRCGFVRVFPDGKHMVCQSTTCPRGRNKCDHEGPEDPPPGIFIYLAEHEEIIRKERRDQRRARRHLTANMNHSNNNS